MVDNKKIKLPQHLQLDSVSPATRLLEKRRAMYEVQKAFEDQKEEFQKKEERFKQKEADLRDKDILIQDHLIKFSTFLQQQEMRRKKDQDIAKQEEERIEKKIEQINEKKEQLEQLRVKAAKIERKVQAMRKFEQFLERVREQNLDEFQELGDILLRYYTLKGSNDNLQKTQKNYTQQLDHMNKYITQYTKDMGSEKMTLNNKIAVQQQQLEVLEDQKGRLMAQSEENTSKKMKKTAEHGQILMTIENLYRKCKTRKKLQTTQDSNKTDSPKNFDNMQLSGENALFQLITIKQFVENFIRLKGKIEENEKIQEEKQKKKDNFEIV